MSHLPYSPAADMFLVGPRDDVTDLELAREEVSACAFRIDELQRDLDVTTRTASMLAEMAHAEILATQRERDALKATLAELRNAALLARDCQRNGDTFGVTLQCGLILNALLGADAVGSAAPGVAMTEEAA